MTKMNSPDEIHKILTRAGMSMKDLATQTSAVMRQHPFKQTLEKWMVFLCTAVATTSFVMVMAVLIM
jgi:hypothetical protein